MNNYPMTLFYDGNCPVCRFEINNLRARNHQGRLEFADIKDPAFNPASYAMSLADFDSAIRAQCADGRMISGVDVFLLAYRAVGLGWIVAPAGWSGLRRAADTLYRVFARNRYGISRSIGWIFRYIEARQALRRSLQCKKGECSTESKKVDQAEPRMIKR